MCGSFYIVVQNGKIRNVNAISLKNPRILHFQVISSSSHKTIFDSRNSFHRLFNITTTIFSNRKFFTKLHLARQCLTAAAQCIRWTLGLPFLFGNTSIDHHNHPPLFQILFCYRSFIMVDAIIIQWSVCFCRCYCPRDISTSNNGGAASRREIKMIWMWRRGQLYSILTFVFALSPLFL